MGPEDDLTLANPFDLYQQWFREAEANEPNDPNAAALATSTRTGVPSVRMVLIKRADERGFCFFTNAESRKGEELAENPNAALCMHWKSLRRQVRVEGPVVALSDAESDEYFHTRSRLSQIGAAVSQQSRPLNSRGELVERVRQFGEEHPGEVPRPAHWRGFCIVTERIEFWKDGPERLHDRIVFMRDGGDGWNKTRLYP
jgi:pyridoxamine 5'-phosphate oxidase